MAVHGSITMAPGIPDVRVSTPVAHPVITMAPSIVEAIASNDDVANAIPLPFSTGGGDPRSNSVVLVSTDTIIRSNSIRCLKLNTTLACRASRWGRRRIQFNGTTSVRTSSRALPSIGVEISQALIDSVTPGIESRCCYPSCGSFAGANVTHRGNRGPASRDTEEKKRHRRNLQQLHEMR